MAYSCLPDSPGWMIVGSHIPAVDHSTLPFSLLSLLAAQCEAAANKGLSLREVRVSGEWLKLVASTPTLAATGLALLGTHLADNGFLTLFDALDWVRHEVENSQRAIPFASNVDDGTGILLLLERALTEAGQFLDDRLHLKASRAKVWATRHARLGRRGRPNAKDSQSVDTGPKTAKTKPAR